jgi:hypothetical protein
MRQAGAIRRLDRARANLADLMQSGGGKNNAGTAADRADPDVAEVDQPRFAVGIVLAAAGERGHAAIKVVSDIASNYRFLVAQNGGELLDVVGEEKPNRSLKRSHPSFTVRALCDRLRGKRGKTPS